MTLQSAVRTSKLSHASDWTRVVWEKAQSQWITRKQDFDYRVTVTMPALQSNIKRIQPITNGTYIDVGCAEGTETKVIYDYLKYAGFTGKLYGIDIRQDWPLQNSIDNLLCLEFKAAGLEAIPSKADIIFSQFALQETPSIKEFLEEVHTKLKKDGLFFCIFLHPHFSGSIRKKQASRINKQLGSTQDWEYAAEYPIVEETGTFYVPHFQRSLSAYKKEFRKYFKILRVEELKPIIPTLSSLNTHLPFRDDKKNPYYPEILLEPSSILFIAKKITKTKNLQNKNSESIRERSPLFPTFLKK